ncbi:hypothetical protein B0H11DRAFT_1916984 [Mycena galericulata]|nr:hypothetical protein B0H11DRAFT_1916984 [Mycena galericulata]
MVRKVFPDVASDILSPACKMAQNHIYWGNEGTNLNNLANLWSLLVDPGLRHHRRLRRNRCCQVCGAGVDEVVDLLQEVVNAAPGPWSECGGRPYVPILGNLRRASQGAQIAMPIGSLTGPSAPKAASFRVPYSWDENAPKLETDSHEELLSFVDQVEEIFSCANMIDDVKKKEYITSLLPLRWRKLWQALDCYYSGSFADYLGEIYKSYPEVQTERSGSLERLMEICQSYDGIGAAQEGRLRRFGVEFKAEFRKLLMAPVLITNSNAVERYLGTLEPNFAMAIRSVVRSSLLLKDEFGVPSKPTLVAGQPAAIIRKNDQIHLSDLMNIAETMAKTNVEYLPSIASIRDANSVVQSGLKAERGSQKMKELVQNVSELKQTLDSGRRRERKHFGEGMRPSEPRVPGLIPTHNVLKGELRGMEVQ